MRAAGRTNELCPDCNNTVVYNGNYFCERLGDGCSWVMGEDASEIFAYNCYCSLMLNRAESGEQPIWIITSVEEWADLWATYVGVPSSHCRTLLYPEHLWRIGYDGWVLLFPSPSTRRAVSAQLIADHEVRVPRSWWSRRRFDRSGCRDDS